MGSDAAQNNFNHIEEFQPVQTVSLNTIKNINKLKPKNCHNNNWIKTLHTAVEVTKNYSQGNTLHLLCIGTKSLTTIDTTELNKSEQMILNLVNQVAGGYMTFNQTLPSARIFGVKDKKAMAWKCDLEIRDIKIKINAYILAKEKPSNPL
ncbi:hypothetical protein HCN44_006014 [Aphidius gifuensis]|uniref:Uncharacterized protein n=1 Tax=Aphidius gifuensis TaxID=684658 RepID=A0A835CXH4_APHGI|nr:hypothetical protein HCN44_006014 [Aphidius gifuensis]